MPLVIFLLAAAVFAQGTSEFMLAGLLPAIADDLQISIPEAGSLTSAFAVGMIVGAPLMAALSRRWSPRIALSSFIVAFMLMHIAGALTADFSLLFATRVVAALTNAGFLAVTLSTVAALVPAHRTARALAIILGGTTLALIAGVPGVPLGLGALVNGATFCAFTYLAPIITESAALPEAVVPAVLAVFGIGSFVGVWAAGRFGDRNARRVIALGGAALIVGWAAFAALAAIPVILFALAFVQGALSFAVGSTLITTSMRAAATAPTMSGAFATASLNVGAAAGPILGGMAYAGAAGAVGPLLVSLVLVGAAAVVFGVARSRPTTR